MKLKNVIAELKALEDQGYGDYDITFVCDEYRQYYNESEHTYGSDERTFDFSWTHTNKIDDQHKSIEIHQ